MFLESVLGDEFVNYKRVYELAEESGLKRAEVRRQKALLGVKTVEVGSGEGERIWLWYIPKNVWRKHCQGQ